ncbi:MAG: hypothetical protein ISS72_03765 [Candidatus Brocadiae bacterium]|nr:hypothetical protein [Candidatus Brocadiia bacterium]
MVMSVTASAGSDEPLTTILAKHTAWRPIAAHHVKLSAGDIEVVVTDNAPWPPHHRGRYNGIASLAHKAEPRNLFVPAYAGLNMEHILDGTETRGGPDPLFEPRECPIQLRRISDHSVEMYQAPTSHKGLESAMRFTLVPPHYIDVVYECIPRRAAFDNGYVVIFWAAYINAPSNRAIYFLGREEGERSGERWVEAATPAHGRLSTHRSVADPCPLPPVPGHPLTLVFNFSKRRYTHPFYYGRYHDMVYQVMFDDPKRVRFSQSPTGGGATNPAWDWQFVIRDYKVGKLYRLRARVAYKKFVSPDDCLSEYRRWRQELR